MPEKQMPAVIYPPSWKISTNMLHDIAPPFGSQAMPVAASHDSEGAELKTFVELDTCVQCKYPFLF